MRNRTQTQQGSSQRPEDTAPREAYYLATQWQLMAWKFRRHRLAIAGMIVLGVSYLLAFFCEFVAPYDILHRYPNAVTAPPQVVRFFHQGRFSLRPFVYGLRSSVDMQSPDPGAECHP